MQPGIEIRETQYAHGPAHKEHQSRQKQGYYNYLKDDQSQSPQGL